MPYVASDLFPDAYQAALASQMGEQPHAEYRTKTSVANMVLGIVGILLGLIFVVSGMVAAGQATAGSGPAFLLLFGLLLMRGDLFLAFLGVIYKNWRVYIYDHGFLYKGGRKAAAQPFRWDQVETAWYSVTRRSYYGVFTITYHFYRVRRVDGCEVKLNDRLANVA